jgi:predicted RNase H-like HicB family nuclease
MKHYIAVLAPQAENGWRVHFPDFPGCRAEAQQVEVAMRQASFAVGKAIEQLQQDGVAAPKPRSYEAVRADDSWAAERGIVWSTAVISLVKLDGG